MEKEISAAVTQPLEEDPEIEVPASEVVIDHDIDPAAWLERDDSTITISVPTSAGPLRIAALTDEELDKLMALSRTKADLANPRGPKKLDGMLFRRRVIAYAINKAYGYENPPGKLHQPAKALQPTNERFLRKLTGELTMIQKEVFKLSGFEEDGERADPASFLG